MSAKDGPSPLVDNIAELMQAFLDALPDPVFIKDENLNLIYGNAALDSFIQTFTRANNGRVLSGRTGRFLQGAFPSVKRKSAPR